MIIDITVNSNVLPVILNVIICARSHSYDLQHVGCNILSILYPPAKHINPSLQGPHNISQKRPTVCPGSLVHLFRQYSIYIYYVPTLFYRILIIEIEVVDVYHLTTSENSYRKWK